MTFDEFCNKAKPDFNKPVLDMFNVVRLIGVACDEDDFYYIFSSPDRGEFWASAVMGYMNLDALKEQNVIKSTDGETWTNFSRLDNWLRLNNVPQENEFKIVIK